MHQKWRSVFNPLSNKNLVISELANSVDVDKATHYEHYETLLLIQFCKLIFSPVFYFLLKDSLTD